MISLSMMDYDYIPLARPRNIRLLGYDGLDSDGNTSRFSLKSTSYETEPIVPRDSTLPQVQKQKVERPQYHALSYVWGDPKELKSIYCNDTCIQITRNLHDALSQISTQFPDRLLWVDALCINQNDLTEKATQVAMMGDVFHAAESVIVWLGRADGLSSTISQTIIDNFIQIRSEATLEEQSGHFGYPACKKCEHTLFEGSDCDDERHRATARKCQGLRELVQKMGGSEWFSRMWTYQELKLASAATVHLGPFVMPWEFFVAAFEEFQRSHGCVWISLSQIHMLDWDIKRPLGTESFASLIRSTCRRKATVTHDKIFGVMCIPTRLPFPIEIDYNLPLDQLHMAATRFCINDENNLGVLNSIEDFSHGRRRRRMSNLPSWVVDFSADFRPDTSAAPVTFGQLPSLSSSESSLNMFCFVLGFYVPGDEGSPYFHNSEASDFRFLPKSFSSKNEDSIFPRPE